MSPPYIVPSLPPREPASHKGTYGRALVVAGSAEMPGAAVLVARAALRSGAGLVTAAVPGRLSAILGCAVPEATQVLLPEPGAPGHADRIREALTARLREGCDAVAVGPGLGTSAEARAVVQLVLVASAVPVVLDADALNIIAMAPGLAPAHPDTCVWTPHPGEFERLTGERPRGEEERVASALRFAERTGGIVVLKGHRTVVAQPGLAYVNTTGNPGMATGGAGDVLTGVIAALLGQGLKPFDAAVLGVYIHGRAGDMAAGSLGEVSLIAGDIVDHLPAAFRAHAAASEVEATARGADPAPPGARSIRRPS